MTVRPVTPNLGGALTLAELTDSLYDGVTHTADFTIPLTVAPFACSVTRLAMVQSVLGGTGGSPNSNYWTATLVRWRFGTVRAVIAAKTNQYTTGAGELFAANAPWTFDSVSFDLSAAGLTLNDVLAVEWTRTGTPFQLPPTTYQWRVEPS